MGFNSGIKGLIITMETTFSKFIYSHHTIQNHNR